MSEGEIIFFQIDEENEDLEDDSIHESGQINILSNSSVKKKVHPNRLSQ